MNEPGGISREPLLGFPWRMVAAAPERVFQSAGEEERKRIKESLSITQVRFIAYIYGRIQGILRMRIQNRRDTDSPKSTVNADIAR